MKQKAWIVDTGFGPLLLTDFLYKLWGRYGWPTEEILVKMVANYAEFGLSDGARPEYAEARNDHQ